MNKQQFSLFDQAVEIEAQVTVSLEVVEPPAIPTNAAVQPIPVTPASSKYSNFIVYVDESGDHGMQTIDDKYPVFVLAFCIFHKRHYTSRVVPSVEDLKFRHFGHDHIVLHEREIRKELGAFKTFQNKAEKQQFLSELTDVIHESKFILVSCVIDKIGLRAKQSLPDNPYHLALGFCVETLYEFLSEKNQETLLTHVVVERRGDQEDRDLELEFRRICDGDNKWRIRLPLEIIFADKRVNSSGLQLADLVARPIGMNFLRRGQANRAFEVLKEKFFCSGGRSNVGVGYQDMGLKVFPAQESEKPR